MEPGVDAWQAMERPGLFGAAGWNQSRTGWFAPSSMLAGLGGEAPEGTPAQIRVLSPADGRISLIPLSALFPE